MTGSEVGSLQWNQHNKLYILKELKQSNGEMELYIHHYVTITQTCKMHNTLPSSSLELHSSA